MLASAALVLAWCVGILGRGYWTPDEPREADISWRMSWQSEKAVPLLAGEAFCEKPPLAYWLAGAPIRFIGTAAWAARLPNLMYALITALGVGLLAQRCAGRFAGWVAAAAISTFLLSYQVAIWLATDAPLLACVAVALLGAYVGFYAASSRERLRGYLLMHAALGLGFLCKSAAAWMVPVLAIAALCVWERRWRELLRWELYVGLLVQAAIILPWVWFVYTGPDGTDHLQVFFWNNLVGRFAQIDAPPELQYAAAHRNTPGKYFIELPMYLFPWTLLVIAAGRRAWQHRNSTHEDYRPVRFALAAALPSLAVLSVAATARNIYLAPALPGVALLLAWWARAIPADVDRWDARALRGTAALLLLATLVFVAALGLVAADARSSSPAHLPFIVISAIGLTTAAWLSCRAWSAVVGHPRRALMLLLLGYCALLIGPASQLYQRVDTWQDLPSIARAIERDSAGKPLILFAPDETTRSIIDMYARTAVALVPGPIDAAGIGRLSAASTAAPEARIVVLLPNRVKFGDRWRSRPTLDIALELPWMQWLHLRVAKDYSLPNGRRYALLERQHESDANPGAGTHATHPPAPAPAADRL